MNEKSSPSVTLTSPLPEWRRRRLGLKLGKRGVNAAMTLSLAMGSGVVDAMMLHSAHCPHRSLFLRLDLADAIAHTTYPMASIEMRSITHLSAADSATFAFSTLLTHATIQYVHLGFLLIFYSQFVFVFFCFLPFFGVAYGRGSTPKRDQERRVALLNGVRETLRRTSDCGREVRPMIVFQTRTLEERVSRVGLAVSLGL